MKTVTTNKTEGFSLVELMAAMAIGLIIMAGATQLFNSGMRATMLVTQRAEMQQNVRAAINLIAKDVSMAASGLPSGGLTLPYGAGSTPSLFGCDNTACYLNNNSYPAGTFGTPPSPVSNYMYGLIPGPGNGMQVGGPNAIAATNRPADAITVIYVDYSFPLNLYSVTFPDTTGTSINLAPPAAPPPNFPAITSPTGIKVGDLILLNNTKGYAAGEVTNIAPGGGSISFANLDPLNINQSGAASGKIGYLATVGSATARRMWAITYFVQVPANGQPPRLMRQVNAQPPVPVADNIIGVNFTYDLCDAGTPGPGCSAVPNPIGAGYTPNQIHKVNIQVMGQSLLSNVQNSQSTVLVTSVSTRDLSFKNRYN